MPRKVKNWKERHIYYFKCSDCGKRRQSFKRSVQSRGICRKCKRDEWKKNQIPLFELEEGSDVGISNSSEL